MVEIDGENPWILGGLLVLLWILVGVVVEVILFDGDLLRGGILGALGGIGFSVVFFYFRRSLVEQ